MAELTYDYLREKFEYNQDSGHFFRRTSRGFKRKAGTLHRLGYIEIQVRGKKILAHRLAFLLKTGAFPDREIDHIDGDKSNNAWINLREVSHAINMRNRLAWSQNTSGIVGVVWLKRASKWQAQIGINNGNIHLGTFDSIFEAAAARRSAELNFGFSLRHGRKFMPEELMEESP